MQERVVKFLEDNQFFYKYQFGFRKDYDTKTAIVELSNLILNNLERSLFLVGIFIDLKKLLIPWIMLCYLVNCIFTVLGDKLTSGVIVIYQAEISLFKWAVVSLIHKI